MGPYLFSDCALKLGGGGAVCHNAIAGSQAQWRPSGTAAIQNGKIFWLKIIKKENNREKPKKFASLLPESF